MNRKQIVKHNFRVWMVAWADLYDVAVKLLTFGIVKPSYGFQAIAFYAKRDLNREIEMRRRNNS